MATSYHLLLKRPEWQRKRLEVMERADFKCERCRSSDQTLNVHHRYYLKGRKPWEYGDDVFLCLCEDCHAKWHEILDPLRQALGCLTIEQLALLKTRAEELGTTLPPVPDARKPDLGTDPEPRWAIGRKVRSDKYGIGRIMQVRRYDAMPKVIVRFADGERAFNLAFAPRHLTIVED